LTLRIGISVASAHPRLAPRDGARSMVARAGAAWRAGLDSLFVGDHHATSYPYFQNTAVLGRMLAEWGDRPFGALYLLPLWNPVLLAEQVGTLAALAEGRFILQCAVGPADNQFSALGVDPRHRPSRFEESLAILRRLWSGETVSSEGRWQFADARISPTPAPPVEVWIGASAPVAIDRAARLGDGWIAAPGLTPTAARDAIQVYRDRCDACGRGPGATVIRRDVYVGENVPEAEATAGPVIAAGYRGFSPEALVVGDVVQVAASFRELAAMGYSDILVRNLVPDPGRAVACIERLAVARQLARQS